MEFHINYVATLNNDICKKMKILIRHLTTAENCVLKSLRNQHAFSEPQKQETAKRPISLSISPMCP